MHLYKMDEQYEPTEEEVQEIQEIQEMQEDAAQDAQEEAYLNNKELIDGYDCPQPDERFNQHTFLDKATFQSADTVKTTYLDQFELGRAFFSVRFLLDLEDLSKFYLDDIAKEVKEENKISKYFR